MLCVAYLLCMLIMCVYRCPFWIRRLESFRFRCSQKIACALACRSTLAPELVVDPRVSIHTGHQHPKLCTQVSSTCLPYPLRTPASCSCCPPVEPASIFHIRNRGCTQVSRHRGGR